MSKKFEDVVYKIVGDTIGDGATEEVVEAIVAAHEKELAEPPMAEKDDITNVRERLRQVQVGLKAPKDQRNTFGNYNYRNCEDILEAAKPLLDKAELTLELSDEVVMVGERYYVKAVARVWYGTDTLWVSAFAREEETKKGMDGSQITGAASSYARKYALNGLFLIDDTKDSDSQDNRTTPAAPKQPWKNPRPAAGPTPPPVASDDFLPPYDGSTQAPQAATPAERIHADTATKLLGAAKLKGISDKQMAIDILNAIADQDYGVPAFMAMDEADAQILLKKLALPRTSREDLLALVPFAE